jgi:hypothetical protein|tara:strand:+ start:271 stop:489 length:219 start_codon:yes stop_codon:yes gene_type:complete
MLSQKFPKLLESARIITYLLFLCGIYSNGKQITLMWSMMMLISPSLFCFFGIFGEDLLGLYIPRRQSMLVYY